MVALENSFGFLICIMMLAIIYYTIRKAGEGKLPYIRTLPAIEAIQEGIGRSAEMGRPIHVSPGLGQIESGYGTETLSGISCLYYATKIAAQKGTSVICTISRTPHQPLCEESIRTAYIAAGSEEYDPGMVRFAPYGVAYDTMIMGIAERERPGCSIIIGAWWHPATFVLESMKGVGAVNIGGTTRLFMTPYFVGACEYFLMGEEVLAAGAYVSEDYSARGSFLGQDYCKYIIVATIILGVILSSLGNDIIKNILRM